MLQQRWKAHLQQEQGWPGWAERQLRRKVLQLAWKVPLLAPAASLALVLLASTLALDPHGCKQKLQLSTHIQLG